MLVKYNLYYPLSYLETKLKLITSWQRKKKKTQSPGFIDTRKVCLQPPPFCLECSHESLWIESPQNSYKANKSTQILPNCIMFPAVANLWFNLTTVLWKKRKYMSTDYPKVSLMTKFCHPGIKQFQHPEQGLRGRVCKVTRTPLWQSAVTCTHFTLESDTPHMNQWL